MSEKLHTQSHEQQHSPEHEYDAKKQQELARKRLEAAAEKHKEAGAEDIKRIEDAVLNRAETGENLKDKMETEHHHPSTQKDYGYSSVDAVPRAISQARRQLKPVDRALSRIIHNPKVESASAVGGATVARPSGLLYGALFSLIASLAFYLVSSKNGYEYNAFVGILAFLGGFFFGLIIELFMRALNPTKK